MADYPLRLEEIFVSLDYRQILHVERRKILLRNPSNRHVLYIVFLNYNELINYQLL